MGATHRGVWIRYIIATQAVVVVLGVLSYVVLTLEREAEQARARTLAAERMQEALWRLDAFVVPVLGRQASLAYSHYVPAFVPTRLYSPDGARKSGDRVLVEISPILTTAWPAWVRLHFQAPLEGGIASPEVPERRHAWVQRERLIRTKPSELERKRALLRQLGSWLDKDARAQLAAGSAGRQQMWARDYRRERLQAKRARIARAEPRSSNRRRRRGRRAPTALAVQALHPWTVDGAAGRAG
jgi:hypothetical protein